MYQWRGISKPSAWGVTPETAHLTNANNDAKTALMRLALKLATGAGKTMIARVSGTPPALSA